MLKCGCLRMIRIENLCQAGLWVCPDRDHLPHCHPLHSGPCKESRHHRPPYPSGGYAGICQGGYYGKGAG